ncbi:EAL domain-containing protein [Thalassomonas viridans]|uniref:cyclic-guanylate-specific phosphodiesterase n=1 Tax=Thalassomonas viridans TaxID=137584 RepID=A0AAF0CDB3_9GAMM|nr:EAL domain-containing protein [Thalassomonas viridans]WDE07949.1 EAL domain-containing protein [Thalassomonas viridans]
MPNNAAFNLALIPLLAIIYFITAWLGLQLAFDEVNITPLWPPTGIALAALLYFGYWVSPGIFIGVLLINAYLGTHAMAGLAIAAGNTLEVVAAGYLVIRYASRWPFAKMQQTVLFILILCVATMISASGGVASLYLAGALAKEDMVMLWHTWWLGDLAGGLILTPLLLTWSRAPKEDYTVRELYEAGGIILLTLALMYLLFFSHLSIYANQYLLIFALLPLLFWTSFRFHHHGVTLMILIISVLAIVGTINGQGPFVLATENDSLLMLQAAMGSVMITALLLMASQEERLHAIAGLRQSRENLETQVSDRTLELKSANILLEKEIDHQIHLTEAIKGLLHIVDGSAKQEFFIRCARGLAQTFKTRFALIGVFADDNKAGIKTLAVCNGDRAAENFIYELKGTPCEDVLNHSMELVPESAALRYPEDKLLVQMGIESYFGAPILTADGEVIGIMAVMDVNPMQITSWQRPLLGLFSNRVALELQRRLVLEKLELAEQVFTETTEAIIICDAGKNIIRVNPAFTELTGYGFSEVAGRQASRYLSVKEKPDSYRALWPSIQAQGIWQGEMVNQRKSGAVYTSWQTVKPVLDDSGEVQQYIMIINDITEKKRAEEKIFQLAHHDAITQLPNRVSFHRQLEAAMSHALSSGVRLAVMFIDLDNFKLINDTSGHPVGDELLQQVARRFERVVGESALVSRFGGDEFTVMLPAIEGIDEVAGVAQQLLDALKKPFHLTSCEVTTSASIGIGIYPDNSDEISTLLSCADNAMYRAKESGRSGYQFYTEQMHIDAQQLVELEQDLRSALKNNEFKLVYQPQVELETMQITGVEALLRWHHPQKGLIPPDKFIPVAESSGLIVAIGAWVINQACGQLRYWHDLGFEQLSMAINLSARQFFQKDLFATIAQAIAAHGIEAGKVEFEITESMMMRNIEEIVDRLHHIKTLGVQLSIDDFGTGYSSLSYLKRFPLNKIKIDRSFVRGLPDDSDDGAIVEAIIAIAHSLGFTVIAEGVETAEQLSLLATKRCGEFQGYYFSKPCSVQALSALLLEHLPKEKKVCSLSSR